MQIIKFKTIKQGNEHKWHKYVKETAAKKYLACGFGFCVCM